MLDQEASSEREMSKAEAALSVLQQWAQSAEPETDASSLAFAELIALYHGSPPGLRFAIVSELSQVPCDQSWDLLEFALEHDSDSIVRHEAAFALGASGAVRSIPQLRRAYTQDPSEIVRHEVVM